MMEWTPDALSWLRMRWADGESPGVIAAEISARFGSVTSAAVSMRANHLHLPSRQLDLAGKDGEVIAEMWQAGNTNLQIATRMGAKLRAIEYRTHVMISYGIIHPREERGSRTKQKPKPSN